MNDETLEALYDVFLRTGDPVYLNMYSIIRDRKEKRKKHGHRKM